MSKPDETPDCSDNKSCFFEDFKTPPLNGFPLVMTYCPVQPFENVYDTEFGFSRGTIFKCLDLPFEKSACDKKNSCSCRQR